MSRASLGVFILFLLPSRDFGAFLLYCSLQALYPFSNNHVSSFFFYFLSFSFLLFCGLSYLNDFFRVKLDGIAMIQSSREDRSWGEYNLLRYNGKKCEEIIIE